MKKLLASLFIATVSFSSIVVSSIAFADPAATDTTAKQHHTTTKAATLAPNETININTADVPALTKLKGIGTKKAEAIVAWRKANGGFKTLEQLTDVKGIGSSILEANRKNIRLQ